jgi:LacI family transcriptional regulator
LQAEEGVAETRRLLDRPDPPTAILSASNQTLVGTLHELRDRGLRVPADISVLTFDDIPLLDLLDPPIGVISRQPVEIGRRAADLLLEQLRDPGPPRVITTPAIFEPRGSVGPPPA